MLTTIALSILMLGCLICFINLWLSFGRYPYLRFRGVPAESIRNISGFPLFGSLFVALSLPAFSNSPSIFWTGAVIAFLHTGGLHVFCFVMICAAFKGHL